MTPHDANDEIASPVQTHNEFEMLLVTEISLSQGLKVFLKRRSKRTVALVGSPEEVRKALETAEAVLPVLRHGQREALAKAIVAAGERPSNALIEALAAGRGRVPQDAFGQSGSLSIESVVANPDRGQRDAEVHERVRRTNATSVWTVTRQDSPSRDTKKRF